MDSDDKKSHKIYECLISVKLANTIKIQYEEEAQAGCIRWSAETALNL